MQSTPLPAPRRRFRIPWGLLLALAAYYGLVTLYVNVQYWQSPGYLAAEHVVKADRLLGREDGRDANQEALTEAYDHYLEAARLMPQEAWLHKKLETLNWRFDGRGWEVPLELRRRADALGLVWQRIATAQKPIMAVGVRDRGWDPDSLLNGPGRAFAWSLVGAFGIVVIWAQVTFNAKRVRAREHEADLQQQEKDVQELGQWRKGLKSTAMDERTPPEGRPVDQEPEEDRTPPERRPARKVAGPARPGGQARTGPAARRPEGPPRQKRPPRPPEE